MIYTLFLDYVNILKLNVLNFFVDRNGSYNRRIM